MVAHTGTSAVTTTTNTNLPTNNYLSSPLKMNLPQNLLHPIDSWTKHDVQKWIEYCIDEYSLGDVNLSDFEMNGKALLLLNEDSFKQRSPRSGDILHKALQQHRAMLKSWQCQTFPYHLWNSFAFPSSSSSPVRRFNIPPPLPPPLPISSFHPNAASGVLGHPTTAAAAAAAAAAACMHPAFSYMFNRPDMMSKPSLINHQPNYYNPHQQQSTRNREISTSSSSSASSYCPDVASVKISPKSDHVHPVQESIGVKREAISPSFQQTNRQPTPNSSPITTTTTTTTTTTVSPPVKQECVDDEDVDIEQHEPVATPPVTSSSPSSSSPPSCLSKLNHLNNQTIPYKIRSQLLSRIKQQPNDVTNTDETNNELNRTNLTNDNTRQIRYYHDRIDFRGDILMKPPAAKNCRILWEFLFILLEDPHYESIIHWENREKMIFRIIQADKLAALWGLQKNRLSMTYEKLSRGMRYYYSNNIISKEQSKRLLYRFMRSPDEIRKSMKRNGGTTNMIYSSLNKKSISLYQSTTNHDDEETNIKYNADNDDNSSSSSHLTNATSSSQMQHQLLQLFSIYSPSAASIPPNLNSASALLFATRNATNNSSSTFNTKSVPLLTTVSKSDRSNSSSPESFDSNRDRTSDSEKQHCSPSQSLSSSTSTSSYSTSTKRKQAVPLSLTARLSYQHHHLDQPLNLAVNKDEDTITDCKKQKVISSLTIA